MRIVYMGTPAFAVPCLEAAVAAGHEVALVVTQPDRPAGRGYRTAASPVKEAALALGLPVAQPERASEPQFLARLTEIAPDVCVVVAFGQKIPPALLRLAPHGCVNVHASLLPRWRGASPVQRAIMSGDAETGVTTMYLDEGWDTGDIILATRTPIGIEESGGELLERLSRLGATLLTQTLVALAAGTAPRLKQDEQLATLAPKLHASDGCIDWTVPALRVHDLIRALAPAPGAYTFWEGLRVKVLESRVVEPGAGFSSQQAPPGSVIATGGDALIVAAGQGVLELTLVQPEASRRMTGAEFARGRRIAAGACFSGSKEGASR